MVLETDCLAILVVQEAEDLATVRINGKVEKALQDKDQMVVLEAVETAEIYCLTTEIIFLILLITTLINALAEVAEQALLADVRIQMVVAMVAQAHMLFQHGQVQLELV